MLKLGPRKGIGTPVRCPSCRYRNLAIDIWCERCGTPLDWQPDQMDPSATVDPPAIEHRPRAAPMVGPTGQKEEAGRTWAFPKLSFPAITVPRIQLPKWRTPQLKMPTSIPRPRYPLIPRTVGIVAVVVAVLLLVPLAYVLRPASKPLSARQATATHLPATSANKTDSPQAAAIAAVQAKTGLKYASKCTGTGPCLSIIGQTTGQAAAAIVFSTAAGGGRECAAYVFQSGGKWRVLGTTCGLPGQVSPLVGRDATVRVPGNCANVRRDPSLRATVATCLYDGTIIKVDGGPVYADGLMWWHSSKGWMAQDFLVGP
jgi:hypothetical protein